MEVVNSEISILLATYNGSRFLQEQLNSLLVQTYQNFHVIIRDDGSTDSTLDIINTYVQRYPEKFCLLKDEIKHRGPRDGFMYMLKCVDSRYYMFCDQDDIWLPNKIELSLSKLQELEEKYPGLPAMVHTDLIIVDEKLNTIYPSFFKWSKFNVDLNKRKCFVPFGNVFTGCTMIFNRALKNYAFPIPDEVLMHDQWLGLMAVNYGIVDNIKHGTIKYRQHGNNVCSTGGKRKFRLSDLFKNSNWYEETYPILNIIGYGSKFKAYIFKVLYSSIRLFFHN